MHVEVSVALNFVISYLYNKLPRRRVDMFGDELEKGLKKKFEGHWYPEQPFKGSGFRCIRVTGEAADPVIDRAALQCGLEIEEVRGYLPDELTLWIDPCEVSYRIGEKGLVKVLYSNKRDHEDIPLDNEVQAASKGFNPEAQSFKPIDSLSSSLTNLHVSPSSPTSAISWGSKSPSPSLLLQSSTSPVSNFIHKSKSNPTFTTAMFAQTKFGSTKLKTQAKRPTRLSPTEMGSFVKQRGVPAPPHPVQQIPHQRAQTLSPRDLSPRDPRQDFILEHQRMLALQQQQQQQQQQQRQHMMGELLSPQANYGFLESMPGKGGATVNMPSPDGAKPLMEGLNFGTMPYPNHYQHLLLAN